MIERIHLQIASEVARTGTVTGAAESLHLTQSALSHAIKKLEAQLGAPLWEKQGRRLRFTAAGNALLDLSRRLLPQFEQAEAHIGELAQGQHGRLRIGMECHPCYQWLLTVVADFLAAFPSVDVDVRQAFQFGGMAALANYDIDMLVTPDPMNAPGFVFTPVFPYELVLVVHSRHRLAGKAWLTPAELQPENLMTYPVPADRLDIFNQFLLPAAIRPKQHKTYETTEILLQLVAAGRGVTALPKWLVESLATHLPLTTLQLGELGIHKHIYLGVRKGSLELQFIQAFIALAERK